MPFLRRGFAVSLVACLVIAATAVVLRGQVPGLESPLVAVLTPLSERAVVRAGSTARLALRVELPTGFHAQSNKPRDPSLIPTVVWVGTAPGITATEVVFPPATDWRVEGYTEPLAVFDREFTAGIQIRIDARATPGDVRLPIRVRYQACDDKRCITPQSQDTGFDLRIVAPKDPLGEARHPEVFGAIAFGKGEPPPTEAPPPPRPMSARPIRTSASDPLARLDAFTLRGSEGGYMGAEPFLEFVHAADAGITRAGWFDDRGVLSIVALVFLGGLALNLTPCVLPMIPINLAIIGAGAQAGRRRRGFTLGLTYGAAMALVYGVLGLIVILTAGTFGAINASPWFNLGIAVLFVVLGLAMFDVITIDFSRLSSRIRFDESSRGSTALAFSMGAVAALLAGACVAPVVIQVVLFASDLYARGNAVALALPFVLGLGMALPWPIAGAGMASLPKPGAWMVRVKQAMGLFILATALYYGWLAYGLFADRMVDPASVQASIEDQVKSGWYSSLEDGLRAAEERRTPVLIDLWATWCKNCLTMDKTTLVDADVQKALAGYTKIKMQAEDLDEYPASELMRRIRQVGLPAYAIYYPK